jgi:outer membrane protein OmpA-like peptidoglycan-associated protein
MMTLFLCFFIILVTMAPKQEAGLVARGLGPFVVALESHGMDGALSGAKSLNAVNDFRSRFGLTTINAEEFLGGKVEARNADEVKQLLGAALRPYTTLPQPLAARFTSDSAELPAATARYLDLMAESLRPGFGQVLVLEGHAGDASANFKGNNALLALARAQAVRDHLVDKQGFIPQRVEARAWVVRTGELDAAPMSVDARLVQPISSDSPATNPAR